MDDTLEISNSKVKKIGLIVLGVVLIIIGLTRSLLGILNLSAFYSYFFLIGGIASFVGGLISLFVLNGPVVILNPEGLIFNPKTNGFVKWTDIEGFTDYSFNHQHIILIRLKNAEEFIENQKDEKLKKRMKLGLRVHKTPISINPLLLEVSRNKLKENLHMYLVKYGQA